MMDLLAEMLKLHNLDFDCIDSFHNSCFPDCFRNFGLLSIVHQIKKLVDPFDIDLDLNFYMTNFHYSLADNYTVHFDN